MKLEKILAGCLAAAVSASVLSTPAMAAAPAVSTDEAAYVNLDYYGKTKDASIVKGVSLNGLSEFTDYGSYAQVTNMTDGTKPVVSGDSVVWKVPQGTGRFYYECTPKSSAVALPWSFDVSYKLNGVPAAADRLAGKSGLVEIDVHAVPNKNASEYCRDNMLLQIGTAFKMKDTQSVEAPGAQVQSLGDYKAVVFAAVPGEDKTCTVRIGTTSFETYGIVMLMVPGTLSQLHDIKDLKEDKDTVKGSLDAINDSSDQILDALSAMSGGLTEAETGLGELDKARGTISSGKGNVYKNADQALSDLEAASKQTAALVPHLRQGQQLVLDVNADVNQLTGAIDGTVPQLAALSGDIGDVRQNVSDLRDVLKDLHSTDGDRKEAIDEVRDSLKDLKSEAKNIKDNLGPPASSGSLAALLTKLQTKDLVNLKSLNSMLKTMADAAKGEQAEGHGSTIGELWTEITAGIEQYGQGLVISGQMPPDKAQETVDDAINSPSQTTSDLIGSLTAAASAASEVETKIDGILSTVLDDPSGLISSGNNLLNVLDEDMDTLDDGYDAADGLLKNSSRAAGDIQSLLTSCQTAIGKIDALNATGNKYRDDSVAALKDTASLTAGLSDGLASSRAFLASLETLLETSGDQLDSGTKSTLGGMIQLLQKSLDGVGKTSAVKNAGDTIKSTLDNELDKFENKNNLLNLDSDAKPVSFTSSKNTTPASIQVVLRTEEIKLDKDNSAIKDYEASSQDQGPWVRIGNLFSELWKAITSLFSRHS